MASFPPGESARSLAARRGAGGGLLARELDDSLVEMLRCRVHRGLELGGDETVRAPEEGLGCAVELLAKAIGYFFADRAHPILELRGARLAARVDLTGRCTFELLDLSALEVGERELDTRACVALRNVDLLGDRVLVSSSSRSRTAAARCSAMVVSSSSDSATTFDSTSAMRWRIRCSSVETAPWSAF